LYDGIVAAREVPSKLVEEPRVQGATAGGAAGGVERKMASKRVV